MDAEQARLTRTRDAAVRKERIPLELVISIHDQTLQAMVATLKAAKGKTLDIDLINQILAEFRAIPGKLKW